MKDLGDNHTIIIVIAIVALAAYFMIAKSCDGLATENETDQHRTTVYAECVTRCSQNGPPIECAAACKESR